MSEPGRKDRPLMGAGVMCRLGVLTAYLTGARGNAEMAEHLWNAKETGLFSYLTTMNFTHRNTDGPQHEYSKVYTLAESERDFSEISVEGTRRSSRCPRMIERILGRRLRVHLRSKKGILK